MLVEELLLAVPVGRGRTDVHVLRPEGSCLRKEVEQHEGRLEAGKLELIENGC